MKKYLQPKYIFGFIFGLIVVYVVNQNVDLLFKSRLVEDPQPIPTNKTMQHQKSSIETH